MPLYYIFVLFPWTRKRNRKKK